MDHVTVDGAAQSWFGGCPFVSAPGPLTCHETYVLVFREAHSAAGQSIAPPKIQWAIYIDDYTATFAAADTWPTFTNERTGFLVDPTVAFEEPHLSYLRVKAQVPMSDGSTFDLRADWSRTSGVMTFGNDAPLNAFQGIPRHFVDRCRTSNANGHQKLASANMTGTLNGAPVESYPGLGVDNISDGHFTYIDVTHGSCG